MKHTSTRKTLALAVLALAPVIAVGAAIAGPGSGFTTNQVVARGTLGPQFKIKLQDSSNPGDVVVQHFVLSPGGQSGWHLHPGPAIITVISGELTLHQARDCSKTTYTAGQVAVEEIGTIHRVSNTTTSPLDFWVTFLDVPVGSPQRSEAENTPGWELPGC